MIRYNDINGKNQREIVLLKGKPCFWKKCTFCDYHLDSSDDENECIKLNKEVLKNVKGTYNFLEVINSGSVFELPMETLNDIKALIKEKNIKRLMFESHWCFRNKLDEIREFFNVPIRFKCGIETFDNDFRNNVLKKGAYFEDPSEVRKYFESICLLVGVLGQTKEMIKRDIDILENMFPYGCVNLYVENTTPVKKDIELIKWFRENYSYLEENPNIEVLWNNEDFGVGGDENEI